ncbi:hypothetical protein N7462_005619 [Penicillium macrosclerotiorum]|uniref:uncharacterized protein n=1 Tax=Penicillium macrosclerotiorum TaxID=303699 RepID=UPI002549393D|nr:uncharacterized protein N7462_005619 [Penicillium macrosclerotiorum]KAJ5682454.1 hypothetical protein N7462_005619 [Penicillium macrosclerotiorum]
MPCITFTSLGLVVLDEVHFPERTALYNILGGSGTYATLGARLFLPPPISHSLGWMLHVGHDFPRSAEELLESWSTTLMIARQADQKSTRGLLEYKDTTFGPKDFKYTTPILAVQEDNLEQMDLLGSKVYHYLASPEDIKVRISSLLRLREAASISERPLIIWEPAPLSCKPENFQAFLDALASVDVFSPNHLELAALCSEPSIVSFDEGKIEKLVLTFLSHGVGPGGNGTVIVRAGEFGCMVSTRVLSPRWLPPVHASGPETERNVKVVDPTGAGNAFLGAYGVGYLETQNPVLAACYGAVGASFAVEQVGMPGLSRDGDREMWNGINVRSRLQEYMHYVGSAT